MTLDTAATPGAPYPNDQALVPLLLSAKQAAALCNRSLRTWRSLDSGGQIPRPVRIRKATLWRLDELRAWIEAGCPDRQPWEAQR